MTISAKQADGKVMPEAGDTFQDPHAQEPSLEHCTKHNLQEPCSNSKDCTELLLVGAPALAPTNRTRPGGIPSREIAVTAYQVSEAPHLAKAVHDSGHCDTS
jgi:hypothetical protein